jgi:omega-6 fatty acid desaturase (delta-12 desaturase)
MRSSRISQTKAQASELSASNWMGSVHFLGEIALFVIGIWMAQSSYLLLWLLSQILLAFVFFHAFVLLHEAGHHHLFRQKILNVIAGHWAGVLALIPFNSWRKIHALHHRYTGWQDLDATTANIVPRQLTVLERALINFAWKTGFPLFSLLYRLQNYWNVWRLRKFLSTKGIPPAMWINLVMQASFYLVLCLYFGANLLVSCFALAMLLSWVMQDIFILSQHTHIPQQLSGGRPVKLFRHSEQSQFTRSLLLPKALSWFLMHNDRHALHHEFPAVPGYRLSVLDDVSTHQVHWWTWLKAAKKMPGTEFLFSNRTQTGFEL